MFKADLSCVAFRNEFSFMNNNPLEGDGDEEQQAFLLQMNLYASFLLNRLTSQIIFSGINLFYTVMNVWLNSL